VVVKGELVGSIRKEGKLLMLSFKNCTVRFEDQVLFEPAWGIYDMAVGEKIASCFNGPADPAAFGLEYTPPEEKTIHINYTEDQKKIHELYKQVRKIRENGNGENQLSAILTEQTRLNKNEWLLLLEILEIVASNHKHPSIQQEVIGRLNEIKIAEPGLEKLISNGLALVDSEKELAEH
jgi:phenylalanine-4-hydroxylase